MTGCQEFPQGNFLSWESANWFLNSSRGTVIVEPVVLVSFFVQARKEILDLEKDICRRTDVSFHVVPYKLKVGDTSRRSLNHAPV